MKKCFLAAVLAASMLLTATSVLAVPPPEKDIEMPPKAPVIEQSEPEKPKTAKTTRTGNWRKNQTFRREADFTNRQIVIYHDDGTVTALIAAPIICQNSFSSYQYQSLDPLGNRQEGRSNEIDLDIVKKQNNPNTIPPYTRGDFSDDALPSEGAIIATKITQQEIIPRNRA